MNFSFSEEQRLLRKSVADFALKEIEPLLQDWDEREEFPRFLFPKMGEMGLLGINYPARYGGAGSDLSSACIVYEELSYVSIGITASLTAHSTLGTSPLLLFGTEEQKQKYLMPALKGEKIAAFGLTEPNAGSDAASISTTATPHNGGYLLNGSKMFITNGNIADYVIVAAYTDKSKGPKGISLFIVERGTAGFSSGKKLKKLGIRISDTAELNFDQCWVPRENLLGGEGEGFAPLMKTLKKGRILVSAALVGLAQAAFDHALLYAQQRVQFKKPIGKFQAIQFMLADMVTEIELGRLITYKTAWLYDQGEKAEREASMAKLYTSEMAKKVVDKTLQIYGGYGYMREYPIERLYRDVRLFEIVEGTSEIQRMVIARQLGF